MFQTKIYRRVIAILLAAILCIPMPSINVKAASNDYTTWKQGDQEWNKKEAWPKSKYPRASETTMKGGGCVVTSIAMLLRQYNVVTEQDVKKFNPWILNESLKEKGCFDSGANIYWGRVGKVYNSFQYVGDIPYSLSKLTELYKKGYACVIEARSYHYVALRSVNGKNVAIMDPGYFINDLSGYKNPRRIHYYKTGATKPPIGETADPKPAAISGHNVPGDMTAGKTFSVRGTISSDTIISSVTAGVYTDANGKVMVTGKTVYPNARTYSLAKVDPSIYFDKLSAGKYYYMVSATNAAGTKTLISKGFTVTPAAVAKIAGHNMPDSLKVKKAYSIKGTITSTTKISSVSVGVYTAESGGTLKTGKTVYPNATSYNLSKVDPYIYFNRLSVGTYYYRVVAANAAGSTTLINKKFTVNK